MKLFIKCDFEKLVKAFESAPKETREMVKRELKTTARDIKSRASFVHRYTSRSGTLERSGVNYRVEPRKRTGSRAIIFLSAKVPYGKFIHEGTGSHVIEPRNRLALRWSQGDGFAFARRVRVSGIKPDPFLYEAAKVEIPKLESRLSAAINDIWSKIT